MSTTDSGEQAAQFETALKLYNHSPDLFEEARTRLSFGGALRRGKSRVAAPATSFALEEFERLGARP